MNISNSTIEYTINQHELHTMYHLTHNLVSTINGSKYLKCLSTTFYRTV